MKPAPCLIALLLVLLAGCWPFGDPPGKGQKAERGYAVAAPIIRALDDYRHATGSYPAVLPALVPTYVPDVSAQVDGQPLRYLTIGTSYELSFSYAGPGMNHCVYSPAANWKCSGYY